MYVYMYRSYYYACPYYVYHINKLTDSVETDQVEVGPDTAYYAKVRTNYL